MPPTRFIASPFCVFQRVSVHLGIASGLSAGTTAFRVLISATCAFFYRFGKRRKRCKYRGIRVFPACLVSTIFVAQNAVCNGFGCGLGGRAGEHHEHQLGVCGPMGGLRWAVFRAPQYERACIADIKHQSCRYCCRTWFWGRFEAVPMAPKHEKGNTTGDHDAADASVRRARCTRASAPFVAFSTLCAAGRSAMARQKTEERVRAL